MIDPTDMIIIMNAAEIKINAIFYRQEPDNSYSRCVFRQEEFDNNPMYKIWVQNETLKYIKEGRLFRSINHPWK